MDLPNPVQEHYGVPEMPARVEKALHQAGLGSGPLDWAALAPLDQFHTRGLAATRELAEALNPAEGDRLLDVGAGLGGPARYLAAVHGAEVTGIELTPLYVEVATMLSARAGLSDRTRFLQGDATQMPFAPESFDHAWTQHVAMNIPDKELLYREIHRVLRKNGRLAIHDVLKAGSEPLIYPVPWAFEESISFLVSLDEAKRALEDAGFRLVSECDATERTLAWFADLSQTPPTSPLNLGALLGPGVPQAVANLGRNMKEGRAHVVQLVAEKIAG